jgi:hypothetical protein
MTNSEIALTKLHEIGGRKLPGPPLQTRKDAITAVPPQSVEVFTEKAS